MSPHDPPREGEPSSERNRPPRGTVRRVRGGGNRRSGARSGLAGSGPGVSPVLIGIVVGFVVAIPILLLGGPGNPEAVLLALVGGGAFFDLSRRGFAERHAEAGDATDVALSMAFAVVLYAAASDLGRDGRADGTGVWLLRGLGFLALLAGGWLRWRAARAMGENFLVRLGLREGHTLVRTGPFRWVRHPNYAALLVIALGTAASLASPRAAAAALLCWLPIALVRIRREEHLLARTFGREWEEYRAATWRLVPGIL